MLKDRKNNSLMSTAYFSKNITCGPVTVMNTYFLIVCWQSSPDTHSRCVLCGGSAEREEVECWLRHLVCSGFSVRPMFVYWWVDGGVADGQLWWWTMPPSPPPTITPVQNALVAVACCLDFVVLQEDSKVAGAIKQLVLLFAVIKTDDWCKNV